MRDIFVIVILIACIVYGWKKAWYGVLGLAVFSYMNPHTYAWCFTRTLPCYQILLIVVFISCLKDKDKQTIPKDWRVTVFYLLWFLFLLTTLNALMPNAAWSKLSQVSKIYVPLILTLIFINNREKLYYLIITIAASIGLISLKGGIWAIRSGFSHRVYGPNGTQFYEKNAVAVLTVMAIPLLVLWMRETKNKYIKYSIMGSIPFCMASALCSWSRGGLLTLAATTLVLIWHSKRKYLAVPLLVAGIYLGMGALPDTWFNRMHTIETYQEDASASSRLEAWGDGFRYAISHPLLGGGFEGWQYITMRDWHSSYIEVMAEHGLIAFGLWVSLLLGTVISLTRLAFLARGVGEMAWVKNYCHMIRASIIAYMVGTVFLGLSYWDIIYHIVFISVLLKKFVLEELSDKLGKSYNVTKLRNF